MMNYQTLQVRPTFSDVDLNPAFSTLTPNNREPKFIEIIRRIIRRTKIRILMIIRKLQRNLSE